jgi:hypothetical protein
MFEILRCSNISFIPRLDGSKDSTIDAIVSNADAVDPTSLEDMSLEV